MAVRALKRNPAALLAAFVTAAVPGCVENQSLLEKSHSDSAPHAGPGPGGLEEHSCQILIVLENTQECSVQI